MEPEGYGAQSEGATALHEGYPTPVNGSCPFDRLFELRNADVGIEEAAEEPPENHATGNIELFISEVANGQPDKGAKRDNYPTAEVDVAHEQRQPGKEAGRSVENICDPARCETASQQTVVNMAPIG